MILFIQLHYGEVFIIMVCKLYTFELIYFLIISIWFNNIKLGNLFHIISEPINFNTNLNSSVNVEHKEESKNHNNNYYSIGLWNFWIIFYNFGIDGNIRVGSAICYQRLIPPSTKKVFSFSLGNYYLIIILLVTIINLILSNSLGCSYC